VTTTVYLILGIDGPTPGATTLPAMILACCIRQFEMPEGVVELAKDCIFKVAPTMGTRLRFPGEPGHLPVVGVIIASQRDTPSIYPLGVTVLLRDEPSNPRGSCTRARLAADLPRG